MASISFLLLNPCQQSTVRTTTTYSAAREITGQKTPTGGVELRLATYRRQHCLNVAVLINLANYQTVHQVAVQTEWSLENLFCWSEDKAARPQLSALASIRPQDDNRF